MTDIAQWDVLLVDDEPDSLNLVADMLMLSGARAHRAADGATCLAMLEKLTPTVIVIDLNMPKPDGWDVLATIRADAELAAIPVVAITAYYSGRVADQAYLAGFDAFCPKPIKSNELLALLHDLLDDA
jgi:CheY-like chemotaxis protein